MTDLAAIRTWIEQVESISAESDVPPIRSVVYCRELLDLLTVERIAAALAVAQDKVMGYEAGTHIVADYTILAAALLAALEAETP